MGEKIRKKAEFNFSFLDLTSVEIYVLRRHLHLRVSREARIRFGRLRSKYFHTVLQRALAKAMAA
ncbi:MAG: hypothetical protein US74_C0008G0015 [Parcubacteria group bacterium GW2011_GWA2_38_13]|nr:MAG: hypothetical protein US74_C0008G0015 [Parcubacteria group bacterium GW2011_GWA2_38_13]